MTGDVFLSNEEYLKHKELIRARQQRIIQVREQSKQMTAAILSRMKEEADRQCQQTENRILSEIRQHYSRELASVRQHYRQCINDINRQHYVNHINMTNTSNEKKKQLSKTSKNERKTDQAEPSKLVSKKPLENKETVSNETPVDSSNTKKVSVSSPPASKKCHKLKPPVDKVPHLPENIIIMSKEINTESPHDASTRSSLSPQKKTILKKSVNFVNKENLDVEKPCTSPVKRYPAYARKPTFHDSSKTRINNIVDLKVLDDAVELNENEIYNRLVHDRIRVLEQKEKILRRRSPLAPSISSSSLIQKPERFSEYFSNPHISVRPQKHPPLHNELPVQNAPKAINECNGIATDDISSDINRVESKKKLLVLELSNAETQTDRHVPLNSDSTINGSDREVNEDHTTVLKKSSSPSRRLSRSPRKITYPSPISKEVDNNSDGRTTKLKKPKSSASHHCRRKLLKSNGVTVTVSSNPTSTSTNSSDSNSTLAHSYHTTGSSESNNGHADPNHSHRTVQVVVNVLSNSELKGRKSKSSDRLKNVAYVIPENQFKRVPDWRKLFENEEKMTESSYFSPPEVVLKKPTKVHSTKPHLKSSNDEKPSDLGYYVQKLLLMRPESIENLDVSSCSTVAIDEAIQTADKKMEKKCRMKIPLYQNSFDDTKVVRKSTRLPYYQNSFDDTIDAVCDFVLKSQYTTNDSTSFEDESTELFSRANDDPNSSSMSDSSRFLTENSIPPASKLKRSENVSRSPRNLSNHSYVNFGFDENEKSQDESEDDQIKLPSIEELCKRGFVSEQLLNQNSADDQDTMEEEEFLKQLLSVHQPNRDDKPDSRPDIRFPCEEENHKKVSKELPPDADKASEAALNIDPSSKTTANDLKNETRLLGWMGTTVQRTLQASAINSTSSGDSSDPIRQTYKTLENLIEEPFESSENNSSLLNKHFTLSPIKVPDLHLTISPVLKNSE